MSRGLLLLIVVLLSLAPAAAVAEEATIATLWPLLDYRSAPRVDYRSVHLLGPLIKHEVKQDEAEYALRPLLYRAVDGEGASQTEILYPLLTCKADNSSTRLDLLHLLSYDFGSRESGSANEAYLFPLLFYGETRERGSYAAVFPLGGTLYDWFGRDEINFLLFPLYGRTQRGTTRIDNILWPFFARVSGEKETGSKFWPLYGSSCKQGVYSKRFYLWPIFFVEDLALDTSNPVTRRVAWPFQMSEESPARSYRSVLWPFFSWEEDREREFTEWNGPWPLVRVTRGESRHGVRLLPFFSDETVEANRKRWYLWPIYKIEQTRTEQFTRERRRVLFFLYSRLDEQMLTTGRDKHRSSLWPLYTFSRVDGVSHFRLLSLLEPLFPDNQAIARSWSPLWRLYQQKWDQQGNQVISLLWNLYWQERQGDDLAWELFPLFSYRRESDRGRDMTLLKGLVRYRSGPQGETLNLFYLPWSIGWESAAADTASTD